MRACKWQYTLPSLQNGTKKSATKKQKKGGEEIHVHNCSRNKYLSFMSVYMSKIFCGLWIRLKYLNLIISFVYFPFPLFYFTWIKGTYIQILRVIFKKWMRCLFLCFLFSLLFSYGRQFYYYYYYCFFYSYVTFNGQSNVFY